MKNTFERDADREIGIDVVADSVKEKTHASNFDSRGTPSCPTYSNN